MMEINSFHCACKQSSSCNGSISPWYDKKRLNCMSYAWSGNGDAFIVLLHWIAYTDTRGDQRRASIIMWCSHQIYSDSHSSDTVRYTHTCTVILLSKIGKGGLSLSLLHSKELETLSFSLSFSLLYTTTISTCFTPISQRAALQQLYIYKRW